VSVCLSAAACPHYCTDPDVTWGSGRGCPLVVHDLADFQSVHGLRCYGNITRTRNVSEYMLVLAVCLVNSLCCLICRCTWESWAQNPFRSDWWLECCGTYCTRTTSFQLRHQRSWFWWWAASIVLANAICYCPSVCLSSVTLVNPTQAVEIIGNISTAFGTLAILWHPQKILRRSSQGNPSAGGVKHKRGSQIQRFWTYLRLYLGNGAR